LFRTYKSTDKIQSTLDIKSSRDFVANVKIYKNLQKYFFFKRPAAAIGLDIQMIT